MCRIEVDAVERKLVHWRLIIFVIRPKRLIYSLGCVWYGTLTQCYLFFGGYITISVGASEVWTNFSKSLKCKCYKGNESGWVIIQLRFLHICHLANSVGNMNK